MCKDCGCSLTSSERNSHANHAHEHSHEHTNTQPHSHAHPNNHTHDNNHSYANFEHTHSHSHGENSHAHDHAHAYDHANFEHSHESGNLATHTHDHNHAHFHGENSHSHGDFTHNHEHKFTHTHGENSHSHADFEHSHSHAHPALKESKTIEVLSKILSKNDDQAAHNREHFDARKILCVNLMSSPGSGKTTLLEVTIREMKGQMGISVIEGDLETENDAARVRKAGANAYQITTGQSCHLDAFMVHDALHHLNLEDCDILFIENVGNLVCPASYDLGEHLNVVLLSVTEGDDKPAKYPVIFRKADLVVISKADLASHFDFSIDAATKACKKLNPKVDVIVLDAKNGTNLGLWFKYLALKRELV